MISGIYGKHIHLEYIGFSQLPVGFGIAAHVKVDLIWEGLEYENKSEPHALRIQ